MAFGMPVIFVVMASRSCVNCDLLTIGMETLLTVAQADCYAPVIFSYWFAVEQEDALDAVQRCRVRLYWRKDSDKTLSVYVSCQFAGTYYPWNMSVTSFSRCFGGALSPSASRCASLVVKLFITRRGAVKKSSPGERECFMLLMMSLHKL